MTREVRNAKITNTMLGVESHGIFTAMIYTESDGCGQGFGGYTMDSYVESKGCRVGVGFGIEFIKAVLNTVGVEKWEDLKGKYIRVDADFGNIYRIGHITDNKWFDPKALAEEMKNGGAA